MSTQGPCPECGAALHFFEPTPSIRSVKPDELPAACQGCHGIFLGGVRLQLPAAFEKKAVNLAVQADTAARDLRAEMEADPGVKVDRYLSQLYQNAYMTGFFRAMAYFQHQAKEGRLIRLSRLWASFKTWRHASSQMVEIQDLKDYTEFDKLLRVRTTKGNGHVQGTAHAESSGRDDQAPVQGSKRKAGRGTGAGE